MSSKISYFKADYESASKGNNDLLSIAYKLGGLVFTGQHQEARLLFSSYESKLDLDCLIVANFHLGLSYTRTSDYKKARSYFVKNLILERRKNLNSVSRFFAFQGASFYRFFFSYHKKSQMFAVKGYSALLEEESPPALLMGLSLDIQAHNLVQLGFFNRGIKIFDKALEITKKAKLKDLYSEIEISSLLYQSEFDPDLKTHLDVLKNYLSKSKNKNDYSKSEIVLQIAKLYFLMGEFKNSSEFLSKHYDIVYKNQNKRKIALLNTLMSQLVIQKGQFLEALSIINVALSNLDPEVDKSLYLPLLGIKIKALSYLGKDTKEEEKETKSIASKIDRTINKNIQNRFNRKLETRRVGEDKVADIMDKIKKKDLSVIEDLIKTNFLYPAVELYSLKPGRNYIVVLEKTGVVLLASDSMIHNTQKTFTKTQISLLNSLGEGPQSKESLISKVWGYTYDPIRHDSLIYTSIARLRKILSPFSNWIYSDENSYSLDRNVYIVSPEGFNRESAEQKKASSKRIELGDLNHRQLGFLAEGSDQALSVSEYGDRWSVTRMTALRDLKHLAQKKLVAKIGRGKSTRYILKS